LPVLGLVAALSGAVLAEDKSAPLFEARDGIEIDWAAGTITATAGSAADLHMPSADLARPGALRRAEAAARTRLGHALAELPLGGDRKLGSEAVERALGRARSTSADYQSNGGAIVRVTVRFADWIESPPSEGTPAVVTLAVPSMHLGAAPIAKVGGAERQVGAAVYRLGAAPAGEALAAKPDRAGRLVVDGKQGLPADKLAAGLAVIYVGKVLK
jgi:hypothetical protein